MARLSKGYKRKKAAKRVRKNPATVAAKRVQPKRNPTRSFRTADGRVVSFATKKNPARKRRKVAAKRKRIVRRNPAVAKVSATRAVKRNPIGGFKVATARSATGTWTHRATMPTKAAAEDLARMYHAKHGVAVRVTR